MIFPLGANGSPQEFDTVPRNPIASLHQFCGMFLLGLHPVVQGPKKFVSGINNGLQIYQVCCPEIIVYTSNIKDVWQFYCQIKLQFSRCTPPTLKRFLQSGWVRCSKPETFTSGALISFNWNQPPHIHWSIYYRAVRPLSLIHLLKPFYAWNYFTWKNGWEWNDCRYLKLHWVLRARANDTKDTWLKSLKSRSFLFCCKIDLRTVFFMSVSFIST